MDPLLVITNSDAGTADDAALGEALEILKAGTTVQVAATSDADELSEVLDDNPTSRIMVAGGDGSLHAVVLALHRRGQLSGTTLALLPLGTGNDFARGTGIPLDPTEAATLALSGEARPVDLLVDDGGGVVVNNVHLGAGAQASRRGARWKKRLGSVGVGRTNLGRLGYPIGALLAAVRPPRLLLRVEVDGRVVHDGPTLMVALGNSSHVGGGTELNPDADPEDGRIDVMVSRAVGPLAKFGFAARLSRGEHQERDDVRHVLGTTVTVTGEKFWCSADGEIKGPLSARTWRLERAAYSMVLP